MCLEKEIKTLIIKSLELEDVTEEDIKDEEPLIVSGFGLDSIDALELGMALKKKYHIDLSENKEEKYRENLTNDISTIKEQNKELITKNEELAKNNQELTNLIKSLQDQLWVKK